MPHPPTSPAPQGPYATLELEPSADGAHATVWLNQPDVRNAFDDQVIADLAAAFEALGRDQRLRAIVLAARGKAFCAGANLHWMRRMAGYSRQQNRDDAAALARMLRVIAECPVPTIARVQGDAYAGGMGLVAACDLAVAAEGAGFCLSEVRIGLIPATISPYVVRAMGVRAAQRYFLTAERFSAAQAQRLGLVHEAVAAERLDAVVEGWLAALRQAGPHAARACKRLLREVALQPIDDALVERTVEDIADIRASEQGREGVQAFLDKRKPGWLA